MGFVEHIDRKLLGAIQDGLPLTPRPYADVGKSLGISEAEVIKRLRLMQDCGIISRFGLVLRHHELGFKANAMVVWDVPDDQIDAIAERIKTHGFVTLCYSRRRFPKIWPYNLYCMIHGRDREKVLQQIEEVKQAAGLNDFPGKVLFSKRRFKQYGARFAHKPPCAK